MGTSALVRVFDELEKVRLALCLRGHPSGYEPVITDFLSGLVIVNGMSINSPPKIANGVGCLAAQLVALLKSGPGSVYVVDSGADPEVFDFVYDISPPEQRDTSGCAIGAPIMRVPSYGDL